MKDKTTKIKTTQKATTSFSRLHQQQRTSLFTLLHHFVMYINKNTFIQVILEQFFLFLLYTKNYKKLQKAPLNRPVVTAPVGFNPTAVTSTKQFSYSSSKYRCVTHSCAYNATLTSARSQQ